MEPVTEVSTFPLLDLPRELRDAIYGFALPELPLPRKVVCWPYPDYLFDSAQEPTVYDTTKNITSPSILQTCRQIRSEAYFVMLKKHQLIRVTITNALLSPHLIGSMLYVVPMSDKALEKYPGFIMTHSIDGEADPEADSTPQPWSFALTWHDLGLFCRALCSGHVFNLDAKAGIHHRLLMHDPFATTCSPGHMNTENQTKFLQPYRDYFSGVAHFSLTGSVNPTLAATIAAEIRKAPAASATKMLDNFTRRDVNGQREFLGRRLAHFSRASLKALSHISQLVNTDAWLESGPRGRPNEHVAAVRDIFNILSGQHGAVEWQGTEEDQTWHVDRAIQAASSLLAERPPSMEEQFRVYFLNARAHRYFSGSPAAAEASLRVAMELVSEDARGDRREQCLEEAHEIARWRKTRSGNA
ncbi:hypothetical protein Daus18300_009824 [Diaporthe australafricana]|uniref:2EXR domain-containing protein n=1 Tax=Diaporthe australafricana TaxID=127596 RepID=A0ABR3WDB2_9PEZI